MNPDRNPLELHQVPTLQKQECFRYPHVEGNRRGAWEAAGTMRRREESEMRGEKPGKKMAARKGGDRVSK